MVPLYSCSDQSNRSQSTTASTKLGLRSHRKLSRSVRVMYVTAEGTLSTINISVSQPRNDPEPSQLSHVWIVPLFLSLNSGTLSDLTLTAWPRVGYGP